MEKKKAIGGVECLGFLVFNTLTGNGSYDHDEGPIGEFYYDVSTEKYVKWPEIKNDFTQNGFLECGDSISGEDFDGKTSGGTTSKTL